MYGICNGRRINVRDDLLMPSLKVEIFETNDLRRELKWIFNSIFFFDSLPSFVLIEMAINCKENVSFFSSKK